MRIRLFSKKDDPRGYEILINLNSVWKIKVTYTLNFSDSAYYRTSLDNAATDPTATRVYILYVGSDVYPIRADNPNSKVLQAIEEIYKDAIKDQSGHPNSSATS